MNGSVAIGDHEIKVPHGGKKVEVAIRFIATPGVVEGVERSVAVVKLGGFVDDSWRRSSLRAVGSFSKRALKAMFANWWCP